MKHMTLGLALAMLGSAALAQDGRSALQQCRTLADGAARLACYDAIPLGDARPTAAAPAAAPAPAPVVAPVAADFGMTRKAAAPEADQIDSEIPGLFEGWESHSTIRLANGQVWQIDDGSTGVYAVQSPKVTIRRGLFGSFTLEIEGIKRAPKVKRVQ